MKHALCLAVLLAAIPISTAFSNLLQNADFETGPAGKDAHLFYETPGWYNPADAGSKKAMGVKARTAGGGLGGSTYSATVNDREKEVSWFLQKTEHSIEEGEIFEVSFDWKAGWQWQPQDLLRVVVFATENNNLSGETVWEETFDFEYAPGEWDRVTHTFQAAPFQASAKTLFFAFYGVDPQQAGVAGFARVDNIELTVKPK